MIYFTTELQTAVEISTLLLKSVQVQDKRSKLLSFFCKKVMKAPEKVQKWSSRIILVSQCFNYMSELEDLGLFSAELSSDLGRFLTFLDMWIRESVQNWWNSQASGNTDLTGLATQSKWCEIKYSLIVSGHSDGIEEWWNLCNFNESNALFLCCNCSIIL